MSEENTTEYFFHQEKGLSRKRPTTCDHTVDYEVNFDDGPAVIKECKPHIYTER